MCINNSNSTHTLADAELPNGGVRKGMANKDKSEDENFELRARLLCKEMKRSWGNICYWFRLWCWKGFLGLSIFPFHQGIRHHPEKRIPTSYEFVKTLNYTILKMRKLLNFENSKFTVYSRLENWEFVNFEISTFHLELESLMNTSYSSTVIRLHLKCAHDEWKE